MSNFALSVLFFLQLAVMVSEMIAGVLLGPSLLGGLMAWGVAMAITAFPVLARIIQEQGLAHTSLGTWFTDSIQVYAVFGAFLTGMARPLFRWADLHRQRDAVAAA